MALFLPFSTLIWLLFVGVYSFFFLFFSFTSAFIFSSSCPPFSLLVASFYSPLLGVFALHMLPFFLSLFFHVLDMLPELWGCVGLEPCLPFLHLVTYPFPCLIQPMYPVCTHPVSLTITVIHHPSGFSGHDSKKLL